MSLYTTVRNVPGHTGAGQTGGLLAEELGLPCVSFADSISAAEGGGAPLRIRRQTETGFEIVEATPPVVVTITNEEHNVPRIPKVRDVMMAHRQPITRFTVDELGVAPGDYYEVVELSIPQKESRCTFVESAGELASRITEITAAL
jgi:electron transfer flavoprotein beta subunit